MVRSSKSALLCACVEEELIADLFWSPTFPLPSPAVHSSKVHQWTYKTLLQAPGWANCKRLCFCAASTLVLVCGVPF